MSASTRTRRSVFFSQVFVDCRPSHTNIQAFDGFDAYIGELPLPENRKDWPKCGRQDEPADFEELVKNLQRIPRRDIYPKFTDDLTRFQGDLESDVVYIKAPNVSSYDGGGQVAETLLAEARINQKVAGTHPGLATYLGCVVDDGLVVRLAFERYSAELSERVWHQPPASFPPDERAVCMDRIEQAAAHLHRLGLAHMDISPSNIMFGAGGDPVLIDVDCCVPLGAPTAKGGMTMGWRGPHFDNGKYFETGSAQCDMLAIQGLRDWLAEDWAEKKDG